MEKLINRIEVQMEPLTENEERILKGGFATMGVGNSGDEGNKNKDSDCENKNCPDSKNKGDSCQNENCGCSSCS